MQQWHFGRALSSLLAVVVMVVFFTTWGCDGDGDDEEVRNVQVQDLAGRTFPNFDTGFNVRGTLVFGQVTGDELPFILTIPSENIIIQGTATATSFVFETLLVNGREVDSVTINGITATVGDEVIIDAIIRVNDQQRITFFDPETGDIIDAFVFENEDDLIGERV
jgi:hypothetical protein